MKSIIRIISIGGISFLLLSFRSFSQNKLSIDLASIRNIKKSHTGLSVSSYYHVTKHLSGGLEVNQFFPIHRIVHEEDLLQSAMDIDLNAHYNFYVFKNIIFYPITGICHNSDIEKNLETGKRHSKQFWSFNSGAGITLGNAKCSPFVEYSYTWGQLNQQFLMAGVCFEIEWGSHKH